MPDKPDPPATDAAIWARVRAASPAAVRCRIVFEVEDEYGDPVRGAIPVPPPSAVESEPEEAPALPPLKISRTQQDIIGVFLANDPGNRLKAIQIARALGKTLGALKRPLSNLATLKVLENHLPDAGYSRGIRFAEVLN